jgi:ABC-type nickel/cobalt efflux system permease component RcnA
MNDEDEELRQRNRQNVLGLVAALIIVVLGALLVREVVREARQSDCVAAGHRNCEPVDTDHQHR